MTKSKISKAVLDDLKSVGYVEGQPNTIPENVSPALRSQLIEEWAEQNNVKDALELPTAVDTQNQLARERAAADEGAGDTSKGRQGDVNKG